MVSSFYSSNEKKQRDYIKDRKIKEENEFDQQERVDEALDKELGLERKATNIGLMSQRVAKKLASLSTPEKLASVNDILINAINNNRLTDLFEKLKNLPDSKLNKKQQLIRDDLKNAENKKIINELIDEAIPNGVDAIKQTVLESLGGKENIDLVIDMFNKTKESSTSVSKSTKKTETSKVDKTKPNVLDTIGFTDNKKVKKVSKEIPMFVDDEDERNELLDTIGFTDKRKNLLDDIGFTNPLAPDYVKMLAQKLEDLEESDRLALNKNLNILDNVVKNNKLTELFDELKVSPSKYLNNYEKKIKQKLNDEEVKGVMNDLISEVVERRKIGDIKAIVLNELIENPKELKKLENMIERTDTVKQLKKRSGSNASDASTEVSTFDKIDKRQFNTGAKKRDTNKDLEDFSNLLLKFESESGDKRKKIGQTIKNRISQQREVNPKIADRMENLRQALLRR